MDPREARIVVVGAGQAGASLVARLRALGHAGSLTLVGAEPVPPYQRPPLSKGYLKGELTRERLFLRPPSFYEAAGIALLTGTRVAAIAGTIMMTGRSMSAQGAAAEDSASATIGRPMSAHGAATAERHR